MARQKGGIKKAGDQIVEVKKSSSTNGGEVSGAIQNLDVQELNLAKEGEVKFNEQGKPEEDTSDIELTVEGDIHSHKEFAAELAFNEEFLLINIHESTDPNAEKMIYLAVNGEGAGQGGVPYLPRGVPLRIKRKFVERLCRARPIAYGNVERINEFGVREITYPKTSALKYPFSVLEDKNPKGGAWITKLLNERS